MAKPVRNEKLADADAIRVCRSRTPAGKDIARVLDWAEANPNAEKVAPLLILFTQMWALQQYEVPQNRLYSTLLRCAQFGDTALWECIAGDYDWGRIDTAIAVLLRLPDAAARLPRILASVPTEGLNYFTWQRVVDGATSNGIALPEDIKRRAQPGLLSYRALEERRTAWPAERDQLALEEELGTRILTDEAAQILCRKFHPTKSEVRKVLDWAIARPDPGKLRQLFLLCTDYQLGKDYRRWNDVADKLAVLDMTPVWEVLEGDWEYSRLFAASGLISRNGGQAEIERLMRLCAESDVVGATAALGQVQRVAQELGIPETEEFRDRYDYESQWRSGKAPRRPSSGEFERRKSSWPAEHERLPRPEVVHFADDARPELNYSTEPTELTRSLDRIRAWLEKSGVNDPGILRPGLSQAEIAELAKTLPFILTEELCELYRWADGVDNGYSFLIYYDLFKPLQDAIGNDYLMMCDLNRETPGVWKKNWFPVFNESHDWWIQALSRKPEPHAPMINYYLAGGEPEVRYRSLTEMMSIWAECYEGGAFSVDDAGHLQEDRSRFEEIHRSFQNHRRRF